jgi:hypothetical protein
MTALGGPGRPEGPGWSDDETAKGLSPVQGELADKKVTVLTSSTKASHVFLSRLKKMGTYLKKNKLAAAFAWTVGLPFTLVAKAILAVAKIGQLEKGEFLSKEK